MAIRPARTAAEVTRADGTHVLREQLARIEAEARARVAGVVSQAVAMAGADPVRFDLEGVSASLLGAFGGLAQQALVDPRPLTCPGPTGSWLTPI
ncbi:MAG TPA: hypothetical protein VFV73_29520 [Streptosporangiaceae bacterium]|nr:hypothetical protein [Streptosporangiaceae bacterium]